MLTPLSQTNLALRDTVLTRASGDQLRRLSKLWGVPMPTGWDEDSWREGVNAVGLGPRGTIGASFAFLEGIFQYVEEVIEVTQAAANPQRLTATAGAGTFTDDHIGRLVRIGAELFYTVGPADVAADGGARVELAPIGNPYWDAANWSAFAATATVNATFLAFMICEPTPGPDAPATLGSPAMLIVKLQSSGAALVPPSYLQPAIGWLLYDAEVAGFAVGELVTGATSGASAIIRRVVDNGATGALELAHILRGPFQDNEQITGSVAGDATVNGTIGDLIVAYDAEAGGGFAVGATVDGTGIDPMVATLSGLQDDGASGLLALAYVSGQPVVDNEDMEIGAVVRGTADGDALTIERPPSEPEGGQVSEDEFTEGTSPRSPLYLQGAGIAPEAETALKLLLPVGFFAKIQKAGF